MEKLTRRDFIKSAILGVSAATISMSLVGCNSNSGAGMATNEFDISFNHGVASGDPLSDSVILWTRVTPEEAQRSVSLTLQVAQDEAFNQLLSSQKVVALKKNDYTVKVDLDGV